MHAEKTILERLSEASTSDDLSHKPRVCDVDFVGALGAAGIKNRLGSALLALDLTMDPRFIPRALAEVMKRVQSIGRKERWLMDRSGRKARHIAVEALRHYLIPACQACKGRGMVGVEMDKPNEYHPRPCKACGGSGKRPMPRLHGHEVRRVLADLESGRRDAGVAVRRQMKIRAEVE